MADWRRLICVLCLGSCLAACGGGDDETTTPSTAAAMETTATTNAPVETPTTATETTSTTATETTTPSETTAAVSVEHVAEVAVDLGEAVFTSVDLGIDTAGTVYLVVPGRDVVEVFDAAGTPQGTLGEGELQFFTEEEHPGENVAIGGIAVAPDGTLYVADNNRVVVFDPAGEVVTTWGSTGSTDGQFTRLLALALDPTAGRLYALDDRSLGNDRPVQVFDTAGAFLALWGADEFKDPGGIAVDIDGEVYVSDFGGLGPLDVEGHDVNCFTPDGELLLTYGGKGTAPGQMRGPLDVAVDAAGNVYVADSLNSRVQVFDPGGNLLAVFGERGSGPGQFLTPSGVAVGPGGEVYVVDDERNNLQIFRINV